MMNVFISHVQFIKLFVCARKRFVKGMYIIFTYIKWDQKLKDDNLLEPTLS
jgi:hypothetical protein